MLAPAAAAIAQAACSARDEQQPFAALQKEEAADFAAIAARIIPTTDTPGANEAGVIYFIDRAFGAELSGNLAAARSQLAEFNSALSADRGAEIRFADLDEDEQDAFLQAHESSPLFNLLWAMTVTGFFAMPKYGGNQGKVGWELIGFEGSHGPWQYPFGHYDAEVHEGRADDDV